jgi:hypothetical protein
MGNDKMALLIENYKYWQSYTEYIHLMNEFMDRKITATDFCNKFCQMWEYDRSRTSNSEKLINMTENSKLEEMSWFSCLISSLFIECEAFEADPLLRVPSLSEFDVSEEELVDCVKKTLLEIKEHYP